MEKVEFKPEFEAKLLKLGIKKEFIENVRKNYVVKTHSDMMDVVKVLNENETWKDFVLGAFSWHKTPQGDKYWYEISKQKSVEPKHKIRIAAFILILLAISMLVIVMFCRIKETLVEKQVYIHNEVDTISIIQNSLELNDQNVYLWLQVLSVQHDSIVLAQSKLETGNFESNVCTDKNNLFGFLNSDGYYEYRHWIGSVIHYAQWQERLYDGQMPYPNFLVEVGYAEDKNYIDKLKQFN